MIGAEVLEGFAPPSGLIVESIPASRFMVFTVHGPMPESIVKAWLYIYGSWLPNSNFTRGYSIDFDLKDERFHDPASPQADIYIPLI